MLSVHTGIPPAANIFISIDVPDLGTPDTMLIILPPFLTWIIHKFHRKDAKNIGQKNFADTENFSLS